LSASGGFDPRQITRSHARLESIASNEGVIVATTFLAELRGQLLAKGQPAGRLCWYLRPLFWLQRRRYGRPLAAALVWARVPPLYLALAGFYAALERRRSPLEPALRSLVQTRISQLNHCEFCVDLNAALAAERSGSMTKAFAVGAWRNNELFSPRERLALEYAETVTRTDDARVEPALAARRAECFDEATPIELTALVAFRNLSSRFNAALGIPAQGWCALPPRG
jgi:AhpD family alkylhydroperoxidase